MCGRLRCAVLGCVCLIAQACVFIQGRRRRTCCDRCSLNRVTGGQATVRDSDPHPATQKRSSTRSCFAMQLDDPS